MTFGIFFESEIAQVPLHSQKLGHIFQQPLHAISNNYFGAFYEWLPQNNAIPFRTSSVSLSSAVA